MPELSPNSGYLAGLDALANGLGDPALQERAEELRSLVGSGNLQVAPDEFNWRTLKGATPTPDRSLVLALQTAWSEIYGPDVTLWPQSLQDSLATIEAGVGFANFGQNVASAFQNLRLEDATVAALEVGVSIVGEGLCPLPFGRPRRGAPTQWGESFIPESAARAGLSFISSPFTLVVPIWASGIAGRAVTALMANAGRALSLADEAIAGVTAAFGLIGESTAFVATSRVIASVAKQSSEDTFMQGIASVASLPHNDMLTEIGSSTLFFGMLKTFGAAGRFAASLLPATETGVALAKLTGHVGAIVGLASTEELQERMEMITVGEGLSPLPSRAAAEGRPYEEERTFYAKLWRAAFLNAAINGVNSVIDLGGEVNYSPDILRAAEELQDMAGRSLDLARNMPFDLAWDMPLDSSASGELARGITALFAKHKDKRSKGGQGPAPQAGPAAPPPRRVISHYGEFVSLTPRGIELNRRSLPYGVHLNAWLRTLRYNAGASSADKAFTDKYNTYQKVKEAGSYRDLLVFYIAFEHGDKESRDSFKGFENYEPEQLIDTARDEFERMFQDAPELPVEYGPWTEFVELFEAFNRGEIDVARFMDRSSTFTANLKDDIRVLPDSVKLGPITLGPAEFLDILKRSIRYQLDVELKKRPITRKEREQWLGFLIANKNADKWLQRDDIPEDAKQKMAMVFMLDPFNMLEPANKPGAQYVVEFFRRDDLDSMGADGSVKVADELFQRFVAGHKEPVKADTAMPELPAEYSAWKLVPLQALLMDKSKPHPNKSYTFFKRISVIADRAARNIFNYCSKMRISSGAHGLVNDALRSLAAFLQKGDVDKNIRAMVLDMVHHISTRDDNVILHLGSIVETNLQNPAQLTAQIRSVYREYFPYADALFKRLAEESAEESSPQAAAQRLWQRFTVGADEFSGAKDILNRLPVATRDRLRDAMTKAFIAVDFDERTYTPWVAALSKFSGSPLDRQWLGAYDPAKDANGGEIVTLLQDITYPLGGSGEITRPETDLGPLGFRPREQVWQKFVRATAFLTPAEWSELVDVLGQVATETQRSARAFQARSGAVELPNILRSRMQLFMRDNFNGAISALSDVFAGSLGDANARSLRPLLRLAIGGTDIFASLLEFSYKLTLIQRDIKFNRSQAMETLTVARELYGTGLIEGDIMGMAMLYAFYRSQGVQAELAQVKDLVAGGFKVKLIPQDINLAQKSPDIEALVANSQDARPILVEVKSREWLAGFANFKELESAVLEGKAQIDARMKKHFANHGIVALYLVGGTTAADGQVLERLDSLMSSGRLGNVKGLYVYFVDKGGREWKISDHHEILAPEFKARR